MQKLALRHTGWTCAVGLSATLALASCSDTGPASSISSSTTSPTTSATSPSTSATSPPASATSRPRSGSEIIRIDISVKGKTVTPTPALVNLAVGQILSLIITADHDNTLHAHGFDVENKIKAGQRLEVSLRGAQPGVYEVELHDPELRLLQVAVR